MAASLKQVISSLIHQFPPIELTFAYGSAVFQQHGRELGKMLDLVFVVKDPKSWHRDNIQRHSSHYSFLKYFGPTWVERLQHQAAGVYYNTHVEMNMQLIKYGVISVQDFHKDLTDWEWLYLSGRLHKPVLILDTTTNADKKTILNQAMEYNLKSAVLCSLLLLNKNEITEEELYLQITGLSFMGDFRMIIGEDKNKIENIVVPNLICFRQLYSHVLHQYVVQKGSNLIVKIPLTIQEHRDQLPLKLRERIDKGMSLRQAISSIVTSSSIKQSIKGMMTAGLKKTLLYAGQKLLKMIRSLL